MSDGKEFLTGMIIGADRDKYRKSAELRLGVFTKATDYCRLAEQRAEAAEQRVKELENSLSKAELPQRAIADVTRGCRECGGMNGFHFHFCSDH